ncbi:SDR family oxidoreductase [Ktedonosporobacter rubrisoli]|uniref:SDR family oxidoreductase n=1 Tax=Ktedonosporobacter rubrisoli TaxID=2509675 RepID=A0A4P6JKW8_KTERU|nr:SDR family oxidoreductase [Ktedonosporobacter rubrisoli]QBD75828.1 SDR family oxidoreductase [Ktedonosporobacter rubrisoli]
MGEIASPKQAQGPRSQLLQGHVALITGASRGIGAATARLFAQHGAAVGVNYNASAARAQEVVASIKAHGGRAIAVQASVDDAQQIEAMVRQVEQELGPLDTLVMNAIAGNRTLDTSNEERSQALFVPFLESNWQLYQQMVLRTLAGVYLPARIVAPLMVERKRGNLIAVSSLAARTTSERSSALASGKAGIDALMKVLARELGPHGVRVNVVAPGAVETEASAPIIQGRKEIISQSLPLRRIAQPEDIAGAILLLALDEAGYLTGNYLSAGGGSYMP